MSELADRKAYLAMFAFLEAHYERSRSDDVGALLSSLVLLADGNPADPAVADDWSRAVTKVQSGLVNAHLQLQG